MADESKRVGKNSIQALQLVLVMMLRVGYADFAHALASTRLSAVICADYTVHQACMTRWNACSRAALGLDLDLHASAQFSEIMINFATGRFADDLNLQVWCSTGCVHSHQCHRDNKQGIRKGKLHEEQALGAPLHFFCGGPRLNRDHVAKCIGDILQMNLFHDFGQSLTFVQQS